MTVSAWLSKLTDFTNLGTFLVEGGPGILLAGAILFWANGAPQLPAVKRAKVEEKKAAVSQKIVDQEGEVRLAEDARDRAVRERDKVSQELTRAEAELRSRKTEAQQLRNAGRLPAGALLDKIETLKTDVKQRRDTARTKLAEAADAEKTVVRATTDLGKLRQKREELAKAIGKTEERLAGLLNVLLLVIFGGWILGTLLSPLNRLLFVRRQATQISAEPITPRQFSQDSADDIAVPDEVLAEIHKELAAHPYAPFYIGQKIISGEEWDGLVRAYYRWTEAAVNLILPTAAWALALAFRIRTETVAGETLEFRGFVPMWGWLIVGALAVYGLYRAAQEAYTKYRRQVREFLAGRFIELYRARVGVRGEVIKKLKGQLGETAGTLETTQAELAATRGQLELCERELKIYRDLWQGRPGGKPPPERREP